MSNINRSRGVGRPAGTGGSYKKTQNVRYGRPPKYKTEEERKLAYNALANKRYYKRKCGGSKETRKQQLEKKRKDKEYINKMLNTMKDFLEQHIDDEEVKQKIEELVSSSDDEN